MLHSGLELFWGFVLLLSSLSNLSTALSLRVCVTNCPLDIFPRHSTGPSNPKPIVPNGTHHPSSPSSHPLLPQVSPSGHGASSHRSPHCGSGQKAITFDSFPSPVLSILHPKNTEYTHFSPAPLLLPWSKPSSFLLGIFQICLPPPILSSL